METHPRLLGLLIFVALFHLHIAPLPLLRTHPLPALPPPLAAPMLPHDGRRLLHADHDLPLQLGGDPLLEVHLRAAGDCGGHPEVALGLQLHDHAAQLVLVQALAAALALR